tara:strand:+ start:2132 stop:2440 length:309 start_codon:yes stop_codon:yes gene_type:complete
MKNYYDMNNLITAMTEYAEKIIDLGINDPRILGDTLFQQASEIALLKEDIKTYKSRLKDNDLSDESSQYKMDGIDSEECAKLIYQILKSIEEISSIEEDKLN